MRLALYQPDIPQNTGAIMRLCAALAVPLDIIEPCGFILDDRRLRRAAMDYLDQLDWTRHAGWEAFRASTATRRLILLTTRAETLFTDARFEERDSLLLGRESAGVPEEVHAAVDLRLRIPMSAGLRSLNVAIAGAMVLTEALRQTRWSR